MSGHSREISDRELDALLRTFLRDGGEEPTGRITGGAMAQVRRTRQLRRPLASQVVGRAHLAPAWAAAVAATLVVAFGAYLLAPRNGPVATRTPAASPSPNPSRGLPGASPTPILSPTELLPYTNSSLGYELVVPRSWGAGEDRPGAAGVHDFGSGRGAGTRGNPALSIAVGTSDGAVTICQAEAHECTTALVRKLADFDRLLVSVPAQFVGHVPDEVSGDLTLAGEAGGFKRPGYRSESRSPTPFGMGGTIAGNCLGCPGMLYHAYTLIDGRPIVISIDWWTIAFGELPGDSLTQILSSLRLRR